jgi:hypothetical protein
MESETAGEEESRPLCKENEAKSLTGAGEEPDTITTIPTPATTLAIYTAAQQTLATVFFFQSHSTMETNFCNPRSLL